jgi:hypothetical protein
MKSFGGWLRNFTLLESRNSLRDVVWQIPLRCRIADSNLG